MTNRIKGEIAITAESGPMAGNYTMVLDFNALCDLEDEFPDIMSGDVEFKGLKSIRRLIHQGFTVYHPDLSERDVGSIIHAIGLDEASAKLAEAMKAAFPAPAGGDGPKA